MLNSSYSYEILEPLGEGAFSEVKKALRVQISTGFTQPVALKFFKDSSDLAGFETEFVSLMSVRSKSCALVYAAEIIDKKPCLVLEYIDGQSLLNLHQNTPLTEQEIYFILGQIAQGLKDLQEVGLAHGDLSPSNILIATNGEVKLIDFGLANTDFEQRKADPKFAAPELFANKDAGFFSDLYSLGKIAKLLKQGRLQPEEESMLSLDWHKRNLPNSWSPSEADLKSIKEVLGAKVKRTRLQSERLSWVKKASQTAKLVASEVQTVRITNHLFNPAMQIKKYLPIVAALGMSVLMTRASSQLSAIPQLGQLSILTDQWFEIRINDKWLGYSPLLNLPLRKGKYKINWKQSGREGAVSLTVDQGEHIVLKDKDFK